MAEPKPSMKTLAAKHVLSVLAQMEEMLPDNIVIQCANPGMKITDKKREEIIRHSTTLLGPLTKRLQTLVGKFEEKAKPGKKTVADLTPAPDAVKERLDQLIDEHHTKDRD